MRWGIRIVGAGLVLLAVGVGALWYYLDEVTHTAIERGGEAALGAPTSVGSVRVRPLAGRIEIDALRIANPPGFSSEPFASLGTGRIEVDLGSLLDDVIAIDRIVLSDVALRLERRGRKSNYDPLIERSGSEGDGREADASGPGVVVRELVIDGATADIDAGIVLGVRRATRAEIPRIVLRDVGTGSDGGVLADQLTEIVIDAVLAALATKGLGLPRALVETTGNLSPQVVGELERRAVDAGRQAVEKVDGAVGGVLGDDGAAAAKRGLESLLGRGKD